VPGVAGLLLALLATAATPLLGSFFTKDLAVVAALTSTLLLIMFMLPCAGGCSHGRVGGPLGGQEQCGNGSCVRHGTVHYPAPLGAWSGGHLGVLQHLLRYVKCKKNPSHHWEHSMVKFGEGM
jgi:hypothetical protein